MSDAEREDAEREIESFADTVVSGCLVLFHLGQLARSMEISHVDRAVLSAFEKWMAFEFREKNIVPEGCSPCEGCGTPLGPEGPEDLCPACAQEEAKANCTTWPGVASAPALDEEAV